MEERGQPIAPTSAAGSRNATSGSQASRRFKKAYHLYEFAASDKALTADDIAQTRRNIRELTKVGEREIHEVVLSCTRARRQLLNSVPTTKPTRH